MRPAWADRLGGRARALRDANPSSEAFARQTAVLLAQAGRPAEAIAVAKLRPDEAREVAAAVVAAVPGTAMATEAAKIVTATR
ncbi:MAG: hypothetical protein K8T90_04885 [Planctomycetes bacterium]|nr:hypothetical protein [Planctomycetota bacterium]